MMKNIELDPVESMVDKIFFVLRFKMSNNVKPLALASKAVKLRDDIMLLISP